MCLFCHELFRDSNVLLNGLPAVAKLTDFDCSKFFEGYSTSLMTRNMGTQAFKALEFYLRTDGGELHCRRSVDVYVMGLTFLAKIQNNEFLIPKVETPHEAAELHPPYTIGMLILYNQMGQMWHNVRLEMLTITHVEPEHRALITVVVLSLETLLEIYVQQTV